LSQNVGPLHCVPKSSFPNLVLSDSERLIRMPFLSMGLISLLSDRARLSERV